MPQKAAGMRTEPSMSEPTASGPKPAATAAPAPELDPPELRSKFQGLRVTPYRELTPEAITPKSGMALFPRMIAPCSRSRAVAGESRAGLGRRAQARVPWNVGMPAA